MSIKESALRLVLKARDTLSRPVQKSAESLDALRVKSGELKKQLATLGQQDKLLSAFQKQRSAVRDAGVAYREAERKVQELAREHSQAEKPTKALERSLNNARKAVVGANRAYQEQRGKLSGLRTSLESAGLSNKKITQQQNAIQKELKETSAELTQVTAKTKRTAAAFKKSGFKSVAKDANRASGGISNLANRMTALVTAGAAFFGIKRAMQGVLETGDQFERLKVQLEAITGSAEAGEEAFAWIRQFTKDTPLQLDQVARSFTLLKNFGLDPMDGTLQAIVDQNSKLGGGMERLQRISLALGQAWGKQKLQGEEIRQLVEAGVPVWDLLAKVTGKNVNEIRKLSEQGKIGRDVMRDFINEIGASSAGAAAKNMSLFSGLMSNMADRWAEFKAAIFDGGWGQYVKRELDLIGYKLDELASSGKLGELAVSISDGFISIAESVKAAFSDVTVESFTASIKSSFQSISEGLTKAQNAFVTAGASIQVFFNGFSAGVNGFGSLASTVFSELVRRAQQLFSLLGADEFVAKLGDIRAALTSASGDFAAKMEEDSKAVNEGLAKIADAVADKQRKSQERVRNDNKKTIDELLGNYPKVEVAAEKTAQKVEAAFTNAADALKQIDAAETRTELSDLGVALAKAFADGTLTQEEYTEALEASKEKLKELEEAAKNAADATGAVGDSAEEGASNIEQSYDDLAGFYNSITSELYGLSAQAEDTFKAMTGATNVDTSDTLGDIGQLKLALEEAKEAAYRFSTAFSVGDVTGIDDWIYRTAAASEHVKKNFYAQKLALEELLQKYEEGSISAEQFASQGRATARTLDLLDQQDLDQLNRAIEQAESGMERLGDSTRSTLDSMQDELDRLQNKQDDIEKRAYQNRKRELEAQLGSARQEGDGEAVRNLQKALRLNQEIYSEKRKQLQQQEREEAQRESEKRSQKKSAPANNTPVRTAPRSPEKIIRLEYPGGSVNVGVARNDEAKLLEALKNAGMRSV